jgi:glucose/arabinose dehydrogenase
MKLRSLIPIALIAVLAAFGQLSRRGTVQAAPPADAQKPAVAAPKQAPEYRCYFTEGPIAIDGRADEAAWKLAMPVNDFIMGWARDGKTRPTTATRAKLLWDREHLYFFAEMEDHDLFADVTEHDGPTWSNDVFELFFKPAEDKPGYYEFEVSANNTTIDAFFPQRVRNSFWQVRKNEAFDFPTKVVRDGTLNERTDKDRGWQVEGRLSWKDFGHTGGRPNPGEVWKYTLCRYDFSVDSEEPSLSASATLSTNAEANFHHWEDYAPIRFVGPADSPRGQADKPFGLDKLPKLKTSRVFGSPNPPLPYTVERIFPKLPIACPVTIARQPLSDWVWIATETWTYGPTTLSRFKNDPDASQLEVLMPPVARNVIYTVVFHPQFAKNGYVYFGSNGNYDGGPKVSRVTRYYVDPKTGEFDNDSATVILEWESDGHNGAAIAFGQDGMMYVTSGDGTSDSDANLRGQDLTQLTCKVLRIDVDQREPGKTYHVPADNPFVGQENVRPETWCYGLRNPWRIATDAATGQIWVGNNGQDHWEQVYLIERGANYGWSIMEGGHPFYPDRKRGPHEISPPVMDHPHSEARSLTGGLVYYGDNPGLLELEGAYLYGDYATGKIWALRHNGKQMTWQDEIADTQLAITDFAFGSDGDIWITDHLGRGIYRLIPTPPDAPRYAFPRKLSETGLFKNVAAHTMADGVIPYSVNSPQWTDGAHQERWFAIPHQEGEDRRIEYTYSNGWNFPNDTVAIESIALDKVAGDPASRTWIETRLLLRQQGEWAGYSYRWNAEGTDAELVDAAGAEAIFEITDATAEGGHRKQAWRYSSRTECMTCHSRAANYLLGLQTGQMNREHDYSSLGGHTDNQLRTLEHLGLFRVDWGRENRERWRRDLIDKKRQALGAKANDPDAELAMNREVGAELNRLLDTRGQREAPKDSPLLYQDPHSLPRLADPRDESQPLAIRVRSYLHGNCAHCHVQEGGGNALLDVHFDTALAKTHLIDEKPSHHTFGLPDARIIASGAPDRSVLLYRLRTRGPGQMPQLGTNLVDPAAVDLFRRWIASLGDDAKLSATAR